MTARQIISALLIELPRRWPDRIRVWRANVLAAVTAGRVVRAGVPGQADVSGILRLSWFGVRLEIEVKAPGDRFRSQQEAFASMIRRFGGVYLVCRDVEETVSEVADVIASCQPPEAQA